MKKLMRMKGSAIGKIYAMFFFLAALTLFFSIFNYLVYKDIGKKYENSMKLYYEAVNMGEYIKICDESMEMYLLSDNREYLLQHNEAVKKLDASIELCQELIDMPLEAAEIQSIDDAFYSYQDAANYSSFLKTQNRSYYSKYIESSKISEYIEKYCDEIVVTAVEYNKAYYKQLETRQKNITLINLYAILLIVLFAGYGMVVLNETFYRPMKELYKASLEIASGNMVEVGENFSDKMICIQAKAFNKMSRSVVKMMDEQLQKEQYKRRLEEANYLNLQLQTNPHFLFNTLNTISRTISLGMNDEAVEMIDSMASMLRYNLNDISVPVVLIEEIQVVEEYLHIQKFRFRDRIKTSFEYDKELVSKVKIPRFSLQPFVENAVIHGLEPKVDTGYVGLCIWEEDGRCIIEIKDNGIGISEEKLRRLNGGENISSEKHKSIGINNTIDRLKYFSKDNQVVKIESEEGNGTKVIINLPVEDDICIN